VIVIPREGVEIIESAVTSLKATVIPREGVEIEVHRSISGAEVHVIPREGVEILSGLFSMKSRTLSK
jgi:hypothetical protein